MKRIVVVMVLAGFSAVLVGGSLAVAEDTPQEPVAAAQQPPPEGPVIDPPPEDPARVDQGREPLELTLAPCHTSDLVIHVTGQYIWAKHQPDLAYESASASPAAPGQPIIERYVVQGTAVDSEGNKYRIHETSGTVEISPGDPDYPHAYVTQEVRLYKQQGGGKEAFTFQVQFHIGPNGLISYKVIANDCPPPATASPSAATTGA